jgi:glycosyltransferase involved in cell wall biosynthesis
MVFFSIILPTYNRAHMLAKAMDSVLAQTFKDWELIIVDDGSTDNTEDLVKSYSDPRIHYHRQENRERSAARNAGISLAVGKYICFLDSDDYYLPDHLQNLFVILEKSDFPVCFAFCDMHTGAHKTPVATSPYCNAKKHNPLERIFYSMICVVQACISRNILLEEKFNEMLSNGEDLELWSRIVVRYPMIFAPARTVVIGEHENRSVYLADDVYMQNLILARKIFRKAPPSMKVSCSVRRKFIANCYYGLFKNCAKKQRYPSACMHLLKSLFLFPERQTRHKIYALALLMVNRKKLQSIISPQPDETC